MNKHDSKLEQQILGTFLFQPHLIIDCLPILKEEYFFETNHRIVFRAIKNLDKRSEHIDVLTVTAEISKLGMLKTIGGSYFVASLSTGAWIAASPERHCRILTEMYIIRELEILGERVKNRANDPTTDCFDLIDEITNKTSELTQFVTNSFKRVGDIFYQYATNVQQIEEKGVKTGIETGFFNVDNQIGGWQNGNLIILAARPGMGKTALSLELAKNPAIKQSKPVAIFSIEMTAIELVGRMAASESEFNSTKIHQNRVSKDELALITGKCYKLIDSPIYIDDTASISLDQLRSKAKKLVYEYKVELIIIDYLQLMHGKQDGNREQEVSSISRGLKSLAKELNIPIIALSQLSRLVEQRPDKRPQLSDLRDSGAIEQDADMVIFIWRPEYYDLCQEGYEYGTERLPAQNLMIFDIAKGRGVPVCEVPLKFYGEFMKVTNYDLRTYKTQEYNQLPPNTNFTEF